MHVLVVSLPFVVAGSVSTHKVYSI